jgi:hypothetical protein
MMQGRSFEGQHAFVGFEDREHDPPHLAGHRGAELVLVHHPGRDQGFPKRRLRSPFMSAETAVELLVA